MPNDRITAAEVPGLRRELVAWFSSHGVDYHDHLNKTDDQRAPLRLAQLTAARQIAQLSEGDLWYFDNDLCALLNAAHQSMPAFAPRPHDLPSQWGFAVFAAPIAMEKARLDDSPLVDLAGDGILHVMAASWGPFDDPGWPAGGTCITFYAATTLDIDHLDPKRAQSIRGMMPPLIVGPETPIAWSPDDDASIDRYQFPTDARQQKGVKWSRLLFAAFQLAAQAQLAETEQQRTMRAERRRTQRARLPERDVRVVRLSRSLAEKRAADPNAASSREWQHRWIVRGHWRRQWYPTLNAHRPRWIAPYLKGPTSAPLLRGEKVIVATAPRQPGRPRLPNSQPTDTGRDFTR
jgi:hypothetical protein